MLDTAPQARAIMAAYWLRRQGWEAHALLAPAEDVFSETGPTPHHMAPFPARRISVAELRALGSQVVIFDAGSSGAYRQHHLPGAVWLNRANLSAATHDTLRHSSLPVVLYGDDDQDPRADLIASDLAGLLPGRDVRVLEGGRAAWQAAHGALLSSPDQPTEAESIDTLFWLHDRHTGNTTAARAYLDWELGLVKRIEADGSLAFALQDPQFTATLQVQDQRS